MSVYIAQRCKNCL